MARYTDQHPQFSDSNGVPLNGGQIEFFTVGNTGVSNRKNTFSDVALSLANPNPISLDGSGRSVNAIFLDGSYNTIIRDSDLVQIDQVDNVSSGADEGTPSIDVDNVTDLKAVNTTLFQVAYVIGTTTKGDGGQGHFYFDSIATESDNGVSVIEPTTGGGRWLLQNNSHDSITVLVAGGTVDAITITPAPAVSVIDSTKVYFVASLGPNTIVPPTFKVGTSATENITKEASTALLVGDTGPVGYVMLLKENGSGGYTLINPFIIVLVDDSVTTPKINDLAVTTSKINASAVTVDKLSWMPLESMDGLKATNGADSDHDIDVPVGRVVDSTQASILNLTSAITKKIDADWVEGTNQGGFPSGLTLAINTWYRVFLIGKTDGSIDVGFDTSATATNLLSDATGYTEFRRICWVLTDGSANIIPWVSGRANEYVWDVPQEDFNATTPTSGTSVVVTVPPNQTARLVLTGSKSTGSPAAIYVSSLAQTDVAVGGAVRDLFFPGAASGDINFGDTYKIVNTNGSSAVRLKATNTDSTLLIITQAWIDNLEVF